MARTVALDFDGVLHDYLEGWKDGTIYGEIDPEAVEAVRALQWSGVAVYVLTSREPRSVALWLAGKGLAPCLETETYRPEFWDSTDLILVTNRKLPAEQYVDDRAWPFRQGNPDRWDELLDYFRRG
jgi:hypothetical protein